jgi:hypothetical protein
MLRGKNRHFPREKPAWRRIIDAQRGRANADFGLGDVPLPRTSGRICFFWR